MRNILQMGEKELLALTVKDVPRLLTTDECEHMGKTLGGLWTYDYEAAEKGRVGKHAILKSELHSDAFFFSRILLEQENIRNIFADQLVMRLEEFCRPASSTYVVGVPDGATLLGSAVAKRLGAPEAQMKKEDGRIVLASELPSDAEVLLIEDVCTRATGFTEAALEVRNKQPSANLMRYDPVILKRGGLRTFLVQGIGRFRVLSIAERRIQDWDPKKGCRLCKLGSEPIKPKATDENWQLLITSQLA